MMTHPVNSDSYFLAARPREPEDAEGNLPDFRSHYRLHFTCYCNSEDLDPRKQYIGPSADRACCLCDPVEREPSFRRKAHLIPKLLGNHSCFTNEECDDCNLQYGKKFENELGNMLLHHRVFRRTRGEKALPKLECSGDGGEVGGGRRGDPLKIVPGVGSHSVRFKSIDPYTAEITVPNPTYRPARAVLSLVKSAWLCMTHEKRLEHGYVRDVIKDKLVIEPFQYYLVDLPSGNGPFTTLYLWERLSDDRSLPRLLVQLNYSNIVLFWSAPEMSSRKYLPTLFPEVYFPRPNGELSDAECHIRKELVEFLDKQVDSELFTWTFKASSPLKPIQVSVSSSEVDKDIPEEALKNRIPLRYEVDVVVKSKPPQTLRSNWTIDRWDAEFFDVRIEGCEFGAILRSCRSDVWDYTVQHLDIDLTSVALASALKTVEFFSSLRAKPVDIIIQKTDTGLERMRLSNASLIVDFDHERTIALIRAMQHINQQYGFSYRFPSSTDEIVLRDILILGQCIEHGAIREAAPEGALTLQADSVLLSHLLEKTKSGEKIHLSFSARRVFDIGATTIPCTNYKLGIENLTVLDSCEDMRATIEAMQSDEIATVGVKCSHLTHHFPDWIREQDLD